MTMIRGETMAEEKKNEEVKEEDVETSETDEAVKDEAEEKEDDVSSEAKDQEDEDPEAKIQALNDEVTKWKTEYYKVFADMENTKKRMNKEFENQKKFMMQRFIEDLLPVIDNFERSLASEAGDENLKNFLKGYQMIHDQLMNILEKNGVKVIEAEGKPFDPNFHQAVMTEKVDGVEPNMVVQELQKGYMLKDRVIRATLVKVSE
jgi:molecular chaperone GrpE